VSARCRARRLSRGAGWSAAKPINALVGLGVIVDAVLRRPAHRRCPNCVSAVLQLGDAALIRARDTAALVARLPV
jgi:hypothetical protein